MPSPRRGSSSLRRSKPAPTRRIIRVHTEGRRTEPEYLARILDLNDRPVVLQIDPRHGVPATLVANAIATKHRNNTEARRGRDELIDEHWCIFDHDEHPDIDESVLRAVDHGIGIVTSNPCFELWLVLHYADHRRHVDRHTIQKLAQQHLPGLARDPKGISLDQAATLSHFLESATRRAKGLDLMHETNLSTPRSNPSTDAWRLVQRLASNSTGSPHGPHDAAKDPGL
jgi:RloB-like protein